MSVFAFAVGLGAISTGCATASSAPENEAASATPPVDVYPPPFSAAVIRDGTREGQTNVVRVTTPEAVRYHTVRFENVDPEGADIRIAMHSEGEVPDLAVSPAHRATWKELEGHAFYPRADTIREEREVTVPAGTFAAWLFVRTFEDKGVPTVTRSYFAKDLPGAPVLHIVERNGAFVMKHELVSRAP